MGLFSNLDPFSLFGGLVDTASSVLVAKQNRDFQREMWRDQKAYNTGEREAAQAYQTGEREAVQEYNSPVSQMSRLVAAGINPNSASGMVEGVQSQPMTSTGATASPSFTDMVNPIDLASLMQMSAQTKLTQAQATAQETENQYIDERNRLSIEQQKHAINLAKSTAAYQDAQKQWTDTQRHQSEQLFPLLMSKSKAELKQLEESVSQISANIALIKQQTKNAEKQGEQIDAVTGLTRAQTSVAYQQQENLEKQGQVLDYDIKQGEFEQTFRDAGIDPHGTLGQSLLKILLADPKKGAEIITNTISAMSEGVSAVRDKASPDPLDEGDRRERLLQATRRAEQIANDAWRRQYNP